MYRNAELHLFSGRVLTSFFEFPTREDALRYYTGLPNSRHFERLSTYRTDQDCVYVVFSNGYISKVYPDLKSLGIAFSALRKRTYATTVVRMTKADFLAKLCGIGSILGPKNISKVRSALQ